MFGVSVGVADDSTDVASKAVPAVVVLDFADRCCGFCKCKDICLSSVLLLIVSAAVAAVAATTTATTILSVAVLPVAFCCQLMLMVSCCTH